MSLYQLERLINGRWIAAMISPSPIGPYSISGPQEHLSNPKRPAFAGEKNGLCRVLLDGEVFEEYRWEEALENPSDETSDKIYRWVLNKRNNIVPESEPSFYLSWL